MAYTGLSTDLMFTATGGSLNAEDVSPIIAELSNFETPVLDWLGDPSYFATNVNHEFLEEELRPNYLTNSTAIASDTAATGFRLQDFGDLLTVGTLLENETQTEVMQVSSVVGQFSVLATRAFGGGAVGSLAAGGQLFVRGAYQLEGGGGSGDVSRRRRRRQTFVGFFQTPISVSDTQQATTMLGRASDVAKIAAGQTEYEHQKMLRIIEALRDLEKETIRGVASGNSIGSRTAYRTFNGIKTLCGSINSTVTNSSFDANPHKYIGDVMEQAYLNGASPTEEWGLVVGRTWYRSISNLNDTKVFDSNQSEDFKRKITMYQGPFGACQVILSRWMPAQGLIVVPRNRVKVVPLQGRSFQHVQYAKTKSAVDGVIEGEYTAEIHHPQAIPQVHS